jgi:hypothetical protein
MKFHIQAANVQEDFNAVNCCKNLDLEQILPCSKSIQLYFFPEKPVMAGSQI